MMRRAVAAGVIGLCLALVACTSGSSRSATASASSSSAATAPGVTASTTATTTSTTPTTTVATSPPAQPRLASDPARLADDLVADEQALRDPSSSEATLVAAARRQQAAYRAIGRHPEWDAVTRPRIPAGLLAAYDHNVDARRQFTAMVGGDAQDSLPQWRIDPPASADELLADYHEAEAKTGVGWSYLASINLVETGLGRIVGLSYAGAQGPMQFLPSTFAAYGDGGDITSAHDSILAAGRLLAANGFATDVDHAIYRYNNSNEYVQAVKDYAEVLAADPAAFAGYYRWEIYYYTASGDVLLPLGYNAPERIPVADYLATHPQ
jgi:membrane-bound lytic murein transglycosylase B